MTSNINRIQHDRKEETQGGDHADQSSNVLTLLSSELQLLYTYHLSSGKWKELSQMQQWSNEEMLMTGFTK